MKRWPVGTSTSSKLAATSAVDIALNEALEKRLNDAWIVLLHLDLLLQGTLEHARSRDHSPFDGMDGRLGGV